MELEGRWLQESRALGVGIERVFDLLVARARADPGRLGRRPEDGGWSGAEVLEHVALTNHFLLILVDKIAARSRKRMEQGDRWPAHPPRFDHLRGLASRGTDWDAPEHMVPTGGVMPDEAADRLARQRVRCAALLRELPGGEGTLHRIRMSRVEGGDDRLDLYQYLELLRLHGERHVAQLDRALGSSDGR